MRKLFVLVAVISLSVALSLNKRTGGQFGLRVAGGGLAYQGQFPWQVAIVMNGSEACSGALISSRDVLTARSCLDKFTPCITDDDDDKSCVHIVAHVGTINFLSSDAGLQCRVTKKIVDDDDPKNMLAILRLESNCIKADTNSDDIKSIPRTTNPDFSFEGKEGTLSGWGITTPGGGITYYLTFTTVNFMDNTRCIAFYGDKKITDSIVCSMEGEKGGCVALLDASILIPPGNNSGISTRIAGGLLASSGQFPWQIAIIIKTSTATYECSGALLNSKTVLTSKACLERFNPCEFETDQPVKCQDIQAYAGALNPFVVENQKDSKKCRVIKKLINENDSLNELTILHLEKKCEISESGTSSIKPIKIMEESFPFEGRLAVVSGWGNNEQNTFSYWLRYSMVETIENSVCQSIYGVNRVHENVVCTKGGNAGPCLGDDGAPLVYYDNGEPYLMGTMIFAPQDCGKNPSGYIRTFNYREWIKANMKPKAN